tara:strand:+ start:895 stop:1191 length:297 start_codon:yes stop_codon:yes gene_type:complete
MNNLEFIATHIHNNPDNATWSKIRLNWMLYRGWSVQKAMDPRNRGWNSCYFSKGFKRQYHGKLWVKIDPKNRRSGYMLTEKGKEYVVNPAETDYNNNT